MNPTHELNTDVSIIGAGTAGTSAYRAALAHTPNVLLIAWHLDALGPAVLLVERDEISLEFQLLLRTRLREDRHRGTLRQPP